MTTPDILGQYFHLAHFEVISYKVYLFNGKTTVFSRKLYHIRYNLKVPVCKLIQAVPKLEAEALMLPY